MALPIASQWRKWFLTTQGKSNLHVPHGLEGIIQKDDFRGYYNDVTDKFSSKYGSQALEKNGIPVNRLSNAD